MKTTKSPLTGNYHDLLIENLKDRKEAEAYLNAALEDGDKRILLKALRNVVEAQVGMSKMAVKTKLTREGLYRMLSGTGNPGLDSLEKIFSVLGYELLVRRKELAHR